MQMNEQVLTALEVLKNFAENDFELHRIDVLINDLTEPPKVEIIDDTHQKFNGVTYVANNEGHYATHIGIHRAVFAYFNGIIPAGYDIHHKDENKANNDISNLQIKNHSEHTKTHKNKSIEKICPVCGKNFIARCTRRQQIFCSVSCFRACHRKKPSIEKICPACGKRFFVRPSYRQQVFCSNACAKKRPPIERVCPVCGKKFIANCPSDKQIYCSIACSRKKPPVERNCLYCGKKFTPRYSTSKQKYCSKSCAVKFSWNNRKK